MYDGWGKYNVTKSLCEKNCETRPSCKAYEWDSKNTECVLRYYEGKTLENVPSGYQQWTAGAGTGAVASTGGGINGNCYEKQATSSLVALGEEDDEEDNEDEDEDEDEENLEASVVMAATDPKKKKAETKSAPTYDKKAFKKDWHTEWKNGDFPGWKEPY